MPEFSDIPEHLRQHIIDMTFWTPTDTFIELAVNREWYKQLSPLIYDVYYTRWAFNITVCDELRQMFDNAPHYDEQAINDSWDVWSEDEDGKYEYDDWRDEEYNDCIKIDGVRHHNVVFYSCGRIKRIND